MDFRRIRTKRDYETALKQAEAWWNAPAKSKEGEQLDVLTLLIKDYESRHFPIEAADPIDYLFFVMEQRELTRKDLEPYIGSRGRVAEVLNRIRPLSLEMIRRLSDGLGIAPNILVKRYELRDAA